MKKLFLFVFLTLHSLFSFADCQWMNVTINIHNPTCFYLNNGSIAVNVTGGSGVLGKKIVNSFGTEFGNWVSQDSVTQLGNGPYKLIVFDSIVNCSDTVNFSITSPPIPNIQGSVPVPTATGCNPCTGQFTINVSNATPPVTYSIDSSNYLSSNTFTGLCAGAYYVRIMDGNGCIYGDQQYIPALPPPPSTQFTSSITNESAYQMQDGSIELTMTGGNAPFTFEWSNGATSEDIYNLQGYYHHYSVNIIDSLGQCGTYSFYVLGGWLNSIYARVFYDVNQNCQFDSLDIPKANEHIVARDQFGTIQASAYTYTDGFYNLRYGADLLTLTCEPSSVIGAGCPTGYTLNSGGSIPYDTIQNFALEFTPVEDLSISIFPGQCFSPGFSSNLYVTVTNNGNNPENGTGYVVIPTELITNPNTSNDTLYFSFSNLMPNDVYYFPIFSTTPSSVPLGTQLNFDMHVDLTSGTDIDLSNNTFTYVSYVFGAYDPNDKNVSPSLNQSGDLPTNENKLTYTIRFQNTGTGPAHNIIITDTLSNLLDIQSFEMLAASHNYTIELLSGNILRWKFPNIMLPDSGANEPESHGYLQFSIHTMNAPQVGQEIDNKANIYFDYNAPIITNVAHTNYVQGPNNIEEIESLPVVVRPNPSTGIVYISCPVGSAKIEILDLTGRLIYSGTHSENSTIDLSGFGEGLYLIRVTNGDQLATTRVIIR